VLLRRRRALFSIGLVYVPVVIAYVPWMPILWTHLHHEAIFIARPGILAAGSYLLFLYNWSWWVTVPALGLYAFLLAADARTLVENRRHGRSADASLRSDLWVVLWLAVPFGLVFLKSLVSVPVLTNRNLMISLPAAYLLLARAVTRLPVRPVGQASITVVIAGALLLHLIVGWGYYTTPSKEQFREAAAYFVEHDDPGENSLVLACTWGERYFDYYLERLGSSRRVDAVAWRASDIPRVTRLIRERAPQYVWYLRGHLVPEPAFFEFLERELRLVEHKAFLGADAWLFETRQAPPDLGAARRVNKTDG
jgi:mannosyltransferase